MHPSPLASVLLLRKVPRLNLFFLCPVSCHFSRPYPFTTQLPWWSFIGPGHSLAQVTLFLDYINLALFPSSSGSDPNKFAARRSTGLQNWISGFTASERKVSERQFALACAMHLCNLVSTTPGLSDYFRYLPLHYLLFTPQNHLGKENSLSLPSDLPGITQNRVGNWTQVSHFQSVLQHWITLPLTMCVCHCELLPSAKVFHAPVTSRPGVLTLQVTLQLVLQLSSAGLWVKCATHTCNSATLAFASSPRVGWEKQMEVVAIRQQPPPKC